MAPLSCPLADAPKSSKLVAVILDRIALQRFDDGHHELVAGLLLFLGQKVP